MVEEPEKNWASYLECENRQELWIRLHQAEFDQIEFEDMKDCRMIHVRGRIVGAVDLETKVRLRLSTETRPALSFSRRGTGLMVMVFLDEWER